MAERDIFDDLDALLAARDALAEDGVEADESELSGARDALDAIHSAGEDGIAAGEVSEDNEAMEYIEKAIYALDRIGAGNGDEDDVNLAGAIIEEVHEQLTMAAVQGLVAEQ